MKRIPLIVFSLLLLTGCVGLQEEYVKQDRQTYDAFTPFVDRMDSQDLRDAYDAWADRMTQAEDSFKAK